MATKKSSSKKEVLGPKVRVRFMGRIAEECGSNPEPFETTIRLNQTKDITPQSIIQEIAQRNPDIADQIVREDGIPRSSTRILINGRSPTSLTRKFKLARRAENNLIVIVVIDGDGDGDIDIVIIVAMPCDG